MKSLNEVLAGYGLEERLNPTNEELKNLLKYLTKEERKTGEPLNYKLDEKGGIQTVLIGKKVLNRIFNRILAMEAGSIRVKDIRTFNKIFQFEGSRKEKPGFLLKTLTLKFNVNSLDKFLKFESIDSLKIRVLTMDVFDNRYEEIETFFVEEKFKTLFKKNNYGEEEMKTRMFVLFSEEVKEIPLYLNHHPELEGLKKELLRFFYGLTKEIFDEEKEKIKQ